MTNLKTTSVENNDVYSVALLHKKLFKDHYLGGFSVSLLENSISHSYVRILHS